MEERERVGNFQLFQPKKFIGVGTAIEVRRGNSQVFGFHYLTLGEGPKAVGIGLTAVVPCGVTTEEIVKTASEKFLISAANEVVLARQIGTHSPLLKPAASFHQLQLVNFGRQMILPPGNPKRADEQVWGHLNDRELAFKADIILPIADEVCRNYCVVRHFILPKTFKGNWERRASDIWEKISFAELQTMDGWKNIFQELQSKNIPSGFYPSDYEVFFVLPDDYRPVTDGFPPSADYIRNNQLVVTLLYVPRNLVRFPKTILL